VDGECAEEQPKDACKDALRAEAVKQCHCRASLNPPVGLVNWGGHSDVCFSQQGQLSGIPGFA